MERVKRIKCSMLWGRKSLVESTNRALKVSARELLVHILHVADAHRSLDDAEAVTLQIVEHIDEVISLGDKRKRTCGKTNATNLLDESVYETMHDAPTREFHYYVQPGVQEQLRQVVDAIQFMGAAQSRNHRVLSPPRKTLDNIADDILHNDILTCMVKGLRCWMA